MRTNAFLVTLCVGACAPAGSPTDAGMLDASGVADAAIQDGGSSDTGGIDAGGTSTFTFADACTPAPTEVCSPDGWCSFTVGGFTWYDLYVPAPGEIWLVGAGAVGRIADGQFCLATGNALTDPTGGVSRHRGVDGTGSNDVWIAADGRILHWDGTLGAIVSGTGIEPQARMHGVWAERSDSVWVVGEGNVGQPGDVLRWNGASWSHATPLSAVSELDAIFAQSATDVWVVGAGGGIARFDGSSWTPVDLGMPALQLETVWATSSSDVWTGGAPSAGVGSGPGVLLHGGTGGFTRSPDPTELVGVVFGTSATRGWVFGDNGSIVALDGTIELSGTTEDIHGAALGMSGEVWIAGHGGLVAHHAP